MANSVAKAKIYESYLDKVVNAELATADFMTGGASIRYNGGNIVEIPSATVTGSTDYDRATGFKKGSGTLTFTPYAIRRDRQFSFLVDAMDTDESGNVFTSQVLLDEYMQNHAIPETDSYRCQEVFQAIVNDDTVRYSYYTPAAATILTQLQGDITEIRKAVGHGRTLKVKMCETAFGVLTNSTELSKQLLVQQGNAAGVTTEVIKINGCEIMPVPDDRMLTEYTFATGANFGYSAKAWAQQMNWFVYSNEAIKAFDKHNKVYSFAAGQHTEGDGDLIQGRFVDDCWILANKHNMIRVSLKTATIAGFGSGIIASTGATDANYTLGALYTNKDEGHEFYYLDGGSATELAAVACYDDLTLAGWVKIESAAKVTDVTTSKYYNYLVELDENGRVIRRSVLKTA